MTEVTNAEGTANKKELSLLRILSAYIKIIIYLSIALSFVNLIQRWGQWSYILPTIGGLLIHMFFYFVVYKIFSVPLTAYKKFYILKNKR